MPIRPYRIQADFNSISNQVESVTIFDCQTAVDPITDDEVVCNTIARTCTMDSHPALLAAINAEMRLDKSAERIGEQRTQHLAQLKVVEDNRVAEEARVAAAIEAAKTPAPAFGVEPIAVDAESNDPPKGN